MENLQEAPNAAKPEDLPPELWCIIFSKLGDAVDMRGFRSLSKMHRRVAHESVAREIKGIVRTSRISSAGEVASFTSDAAER